MPINTRAYLENYAQIRDKRGRVIPLRLNAPQLKLYRALAAQYRDGRPMRAIVLKARQMGFSTLAQGILFKRTLTRRGVRSGIIAHRDEAAAHLYEMSKLMLERLPDALRPAVAANNARELAFSGAGRGLGGSIRVMTAGGAGIGRSDTFQNLHISELAFWPGDKRLTLAGAMQAVPDRPDTMVIIESTANGFDEFKRMWDRAVAGESEFVPVFCAWWELAEYRREPEPGAQWTDEERALCARYGLDDWQLAWRRWCIENNCAGDLDLFRQEYPACPEEAFLSTGACVFDKARIAERLRALQAAGAGKAAAGNGAIEDAVRQDLKAGANSDAVETPCGLGRAFGAARMDLGNAGVSDRAAGFSSVVGDGAPAAAAARAVERSDVSVMPRDAEDAVGAGMAASRDGGVSAAAAGAVWQDLKAGANSDAVETPCGLGRATGAARMDLGNVGSFRLDRAEKAVGCSAVAAGCSTAARDVAAAGAVGQSDVSVASRAAEDAAGVGMAAARDGGVSSAAAGAVRQDLKAGANSDAVETPCGLGRAFGAARMDLGDAKFCFAEGEEAAVCSEAAPPGAAAASAPPAASPFATRPGASGACTPVAPSFVPRAAVRRVRPVYAIEIRGGCEVLAPGGVVDDRRGSVAVYEEPQAGVPYVIGADTAGEGSDWFVAQVLDNRDGRQVAVLRRRCDEDAFACELMALGYWYNTALLGIEANFSTYPIKTCERLGYPRQFVREEEDSYTHRLQRRLGVRTTARTRPLMLAELVRVVRDETHTLNDETTLREMLAFVRNARGRPEAMPGEHDDCVMALAIAHYIRGQQSRLAEAPRPPTLPGPPAFERQMADVLAFGT